MVILVPETKRIANLAKHGIDLADFETGFSWDRCLVPLPEREAPPARGTLRRSSR